MASELIGRTKCPECDFGAAHVKRSAKCLYRHCPECGAAYYATGSKREAALLAKTRTEGGAPPPAAAAPPKPATPPAAPAPTTKPAPAAPARSWASL